MKLIVVLLTLLSVDLSLSYNYRIRDALLDDIINESWLGLPSIHKHPGDEIAATRGLSLSNFALDFVESEKDFTLHADLPGFKKEDIQMTIDNGVLHMEANKEETTEEDKGKYHYKERKWGKVHRSYHLPTNADKEHVVAAYTDGVLTLKFDKIDVPTVKKIIIQ